MALIDPNIAMSYRGVEIPNQLAQYGQLAQIQNAQNQNQLAQYQLSSAQRADEQQNNLYAAAKQPGFALDFASALKYGAPGLAAFKAQQEAAASKLTQTKTQGEIDAQGIAAAQKRVDAFSTALAPLVIAVQSNKPITHDDVFGQATRLVAQGLLRQEDLASIPMKAEQLPSFVMNMASSTENSRKALETYLPKALVAGGSVINQNPLAAGGIGNKLADVTMTPFENARVPILQQQANAATTSSNAAMTNANTARDRLTKESDPAFQQRMTNARTTGELIAKGDVAAIQALPKVIGDAEMAVGVLDQMVGKRDSATGKLLTKDPVTGKPIANNKPHPGFAPAVGMGGFGTLGIPGLAQITPGTDAANFKTLYDQVTGIAFSEAFETLKGGGSITQTEGLKATAARNRMALAQSEDEFVKAASEYRNILAKGVERAQSKATTATNRMTPVAPAAGGVIDYGSLK